MIDARNYDTIVIGADYDNSLVPGSEHQADVRGNGLQALGNLCLALHTIEPEWAFGAVTGRSLESLDKDYQELEASHDLLFPFRFKITSVGSRLHYRDLNGEFTLDTSWPGSMVEMVEWNRSAIQELMDSRAELDIQPDNAQHDFKLSYFVNGIPDEYHEEYVNGLTDRLGGLEAEILFSGNKNLDFLPKGVNKGSALQHYATSFENSFIVAFEDGMNGKEQLAAADLAVTPANAEDNLKTWVKKNIPPERRYEATLPFAGGLLEALEVAQIVGL